MKIGIVFDANVYIAALKRGTYSEYWLRQSSMIPSLEVYTSEQILLEVQTKLEEKFDLSRSQAVGYVAQLRAVATVVAPQQKLAVVAADPDDNKVVECAVEAQAQMVITMDHHLLDLKEYQHIKFVNPGMLQHIFSEA